MRLMGWILFWVGAIGLTGLFIIGVRQSQVRKDWRFWVGFAGVVLCNIGIWVIGRL